MSLDLYSRMVEEFRETNSTVVFGNKSASHASFVVSTLLKGAESTVKILTGSACESFFLKNKSVQDSLALSASAGCLIQFIVVNNKNVNLRSKLLKMSNRIELIEAAAAPQTSEQIAHYMVVDGKRYRLEEPHSQFPRIDSSTVVTATVCMNDVVTAGMLEKNFDTLWKRLKSE